MVLGEVSAFKELVKELGDDQRVFPQIDQFRVITKEIHKFMEDTIGIRVGLIQSVGLPLGEQSRRLRTLRTLIRSLYAFLYGTYIGMHPIPRQMYYLTDHLLKCYHLICNYVISISDAIQVISLSDFLKAYRCDFSYVELWNLIKDRKFYFLQIVRKISTPARFLDWIMVLHEIGHIIDAEKNIVDAHIPELSLFDAMRIIREGSILHGPILYEKAKTKLHASEFAADLIVTDTYGGALGWRFLKEYGHWAEVFEDARTHPLPNQRISVMIDELKSFLGLEPVSRLLRAQLQERGWVEDLAASSAIAQLPRIRATIRTLASHMLTEQEIRDELCKKLATDKSLSTTGIEDAIRSIQRDLLRGRPTILSPPLLFYMYMFELWDAGETRERYKIVQEMSEKLRISAEEFDARIAELLCDCVRLFSVSEAW